MELEVDNNMKKCITYALSPKRVSDPAYEKDWLTDWIPACDQEHHTPPATAACTVIMLSGCNNGGLVQVSRCWVFV